MNQPIDYVVIGIAFVCLLCLIFIMRLLWMFHGYMVMSEVNWSDDQVLIKVEQGGSIVYEGRYDKAPEYIQKMYAEKKEEMQRLMK